MPAGASHYPICEFLRRLAEEFGPSRDEFVQTLGYRNIERGRRRLDAWLDEGEGYDRILKQIAATYPASADELEKAIVTTKVIKNAEADAAFLERCKAEHESFTPFIYAEGESIRPNGITMFGVTGGHRRWTSIQVPAAMLELSLEEQLAKLPELMSTYKRRNNNICPFFGKLTGFKFVRLIDHFQFDADGRLMEHVRKPFRPGACWVEFR